MTVRRAVIAWAIGFAALIGAFAVTLVILNSTVFSAHGFVASYLDALNRHDATTARELPGVHAPDAVATTLLTDSALGSITHIKLLGDDSNSHGVHDVRYSYELGKSRETTDFHVAKTTAYLGMFPRWTFSTSPLATVSVTVLHDQRFRVNGTAIQSGAKSDTAASYEVFAPGRYVFDHKSTYLTASPVNVAVAEPGSVTPVQVDVQANATFVKAVRTELDKYLAGCAKQQVLLPTSCPFGKSFNNRVVSAPSWSMKTYPAITIVPDGNTGNWLVPSTTATAHLTVKVQSLFTGAVSTFDDDVPFPVSFSIDIGANEHLTITSLYS